VIDKLLPFLEEYHMRGEAARALGRIPAGDRAGSVVDKLLAIDAWESEILVAEAIRQIAARDRTGRVLDQLLTVLRDGGLDNAEGGREHAGRARRGQTHRNPALVSVPSKKLKRGASRPLLRTPALPLVSRRNRR
jgi:hypothetical protein